MPGDQSLSLLGRCLRAANFLELRKSRSATSENAQNANFAFTEFLRSCARSCNASYLAVLHNGARMSGPAHIKGGSYYETHPRACYDGSTHGGDVGYLGEPCTSRNQEGLLWSIHYPGSLLEGYAEHAREGQARGDQALPELFHHELSTQSRIPRRLYRQRHKPGRLSHATWCHAPPRRLHQPVPL